MSTLADIRQEVYDDLRQTSANSNFDSATIDRKINRAVEITAALAEGNKDYIEVTVETGIGGYTLPSDNLVIGSAYFGDKSVVDDLVPIDIFTEDVIKAVNPFWLDESTSTTGKPARLILLDAVTVYLDPRPSATYAGKKLVLGYVFRPATLALTTDTPQLNVTFHGIIHFYATSLLYLSLGESDKAQYFYSRWKDEYNMIKNLGTRGANEALGFKFLVKED